MKIVLILFLFIPVLSFSQDIPRFPSKDGKIVYEHIDSSVVAGKDDLYGRAKKWIAKSFNSANAVIQSDDKEIGQLIIKGNSNFVTTLTDKIKFVIEISLKQNKYRIRLSDMEMYMPGLEFLAKTPEGIYKKYSENNYPFKTKKEEIQAKEEKDKDKEFLLKTDLFAKELIASIQKELSTKNDF